mgnify:CR=1 FL=1
MNNRIQSIAMARRMFEYRIYPKRKHISRLYTQFDLSCKAYNNLLGIQRTTYKTTGKGMSKFAMNKAISEMKKADPTLKGAHSQVLQNCSDRLSKAFQSFFRRVKEKKAGKRVKVGYPRFKGRVHSITFPQGGFWLEGEYLRVSKVGRIPLVYHRPTVGEVKTMTIKRERSGKWFVVFSCDIGDAVAGHPNPEKTIGIDLNVENFAALSNGEIIENPRHLKQSEKRLKRLQRRVSRKQKGSNNRRKAKHLLAVQHEKIANQRKDFLHKLSHQLVDEYGTIAMENLNVAGMMKNHCLAKSIGDVSWSEFRRLAEYKAESAGTKLIVVDARGTSQDCSNCGKVVPKKLSERTHRCPKCGLELHRDVNAAINILHRAGHARINACGHTTSTLGLAPSASRVVESGTIRGGR